jgi:hypothetical protein
MQSNYLTNPDGSRTLTTSTPGYSGGGGSDDLTAMLMDMMRRRQSAEEEARRQALYQANKPKSMLGQVGTHGSGARRSAPTETGAGTIDAGNKFLAQMVEREKMNALLNPAPMKAVTGFNQIGSASGMDTLDTNSMNGMQRQIYMPSGSGFEAAGLSHGEQMKLKNAGDGSANRFNSPQQPNQYGSGGGWDTMPDALRVKYLRGEVK